MINNNALYPHSTSLGEKDFHSHSIPKSKGGKVKSDYSDKENQGTLGQSAVKGIYMVSKEKTNTRGRAWHFCSSQRGSLALTLLAPPPCHLGTLNPSFSLQHKCNPAEDLLWDPKDNSKEPCQGI